MQVYVQFIDKSGFYKGSRDSEFFFLNAFESKLRFANSEPLPIKKS
jgi:hypothetical protein